MKYCPSWAETQPTGPIYVPTSGMIMTYMLRYIVTRLHRQPPVMSKQQTSNLLVPLYMSNKFCWCPFFFVLGDTFRVFCSLQILRLGVFASSCRLSRKDCTMYMTIDSSPCTPDWTPSKHTQN